MSLALYNTLWAALTPVGALYLHASRHHQLSARFNPPVPAFPVPPILVHACSVGEVNTAIPLISAFRELAPALPVLLTASTASGHELALKCSNGIPVAWFPFDSRRGVRRFLNRLNPALIVLVETEIWPNIILEAQRRGIPTAVLNARISDKHLRGYQRFPGLFMPVFAALTAIGAQERRYADRYIALGAKEEQVRVTGNMKFDAVRTEIDPRTRAKLRQECGFGDDPLLVFGSTRPGDEALAIECFRELRGAFPRLRLLIAPRHLDRVKEILGLFNEPIYRRTETRSGSGPRSSRIFLLDTVGELNTFYSIATMAVVGGSFYAGVEGHNPLEPAALGVPTLFGPYMQNFADPVATLLRCEAAVQVTSPAALAGRLREVLADPAMQRQLGNRARKAVLDNRGACRRNAQLALDLITQQHADRESD